jgi:outer membrane protein assembly factor BamB
MKSIKVAVSGFSLMIVLLTCSNKKTELVWNKTHPVIGSQSSLRATDLNEDGILDLVIGAGKNERQFSKKGVLAFDGNTGDLLWQQETDDQVFGSATFYDITNDGVHDIFIGGRSPNFKALDGKTGEMIWKYNHEQYMNDSILKHARFNFYNTVLIPDQNNNGFQELLTVNGGNSKAPANSERDRFPGVLMIIDAKSGEIVRADTMPDGKESYMSPICFLQPGSKDHTIIFGSGGETIDGNLYKISLSNFMHSGLLKSTIIASEVGHGFIAPPVAVDITQDGLFDIVAISHASSIFAINGKDNSVLWQRQIKNTESSNSLAIGYFNRDKIPDFFTFVSKGRWPDNRGSMQIMLDGRSGQIEYIDSIGCTGFSSPVVYDLNNDGIDEAIVSINEYDCSIGYLEKVSGTIVNKILAIDFNNQAEVIIDQQQGFKNIFTTPWIGDIDNDTYLDIVYCQYFSPNSNILAFLGMKVRRISTHIKAKKQPIWGAYMGSEGDGVFHLNN